MNLNEVSCTLLVAGASVLYLPGFATVFSSYLCPLPGFATDLFDPDAFRHPIFSALREPLREVRMASFAFPYRGIGLPVAEGARRAHTILTQVWSKSFRHGPESAYERHLSAQMAIRIALSVVREAVLLEKRIPLGSADQFMIDVTEKWGPVLKEILESDGSQGEHSDAQVWARFRRVVPLVEVEAHEARRIIQTVRRPPVDAVVHDALRPARLAVDIALPRFPTRGRAPSTARRTVSSATQELRTMHLQRLLTYLTTVSEAVEGWVGVLEEIAGAPPAVALVPSLPSRRLPTPQYSASNGRRTVRWRSCVERASNCTVA